MHPTVDEVIKRIDSWRGKKIRHEPLGGGITNHNFTAYVDDKPYVIRIPGAGTEIFIDRDNELDCSIQAGKTGVSPEVIHHLKPENISVVSFIKGKTLTTRQIKGDDDLIVRIIKAVKIIHENAVFKSTFNPFDTIRKYRGFVEKYDAPLPEDINWMYDLSDEIEKAMNRNKSADVACHNDYLSENFIDDGKNIWIIDWEYGGMGDRYFDLGDFAVEHPFSREQEELIIREYCGDMRYDWLSRMLLYKIIADLWWSIWAMIQSKISKIDFDFFQYGTARFNRLRKNACDSDYRNWIEAVYC
jgi:thiamine kinase-like enzyme